MAIKDLKSGDVGKRLGVIMLEVAAAMAILTFLFFTYYKVWDSGVKRGESNRDITSITNYVQSTNYTEATNITTVYDTTIKERVDVRVVYVTNKIEVKDDE